MGGRREERHLARVELGVHLVEGKNVFHVALVVLEHEGHVVEVHAVVLQVLAQVLEALEVFGLAGTLRVGDKHDTVYAAEHQLTGTVVIDLARNRVQLETSLKTFDITKIERKEVEKQRAVAFGREGHHVRALVRRHLLVDYLEVRGLATETRPVIDHLTTDFACCKID